MPESKTITCDDLQADIRRYTGELGYRLDMIMPADGPREAIVSKDGISIIMVKRSDSEPGTLNLEPSRSTEWVPGRAGMMYRDLIPGRLGGKLIASHIRIVDGGKVPDSVHYHKIDFQIIFCLKGAIRVVYEDQGPPFWLRPGDCVSQPPEIRHRVLEAEAGSEVIEITSPAEHETWFDHDLDLPTHSLKPDRLFGGQCFVHHIEESVT
jgi:quercetin dioxygenase-like cupin family protein